MKIIHRRRGTAIIVTPKGILLTADKHKLFILPGGGAEGSETVKEATIRELKEETGLDATYTKFLFRHEAEPYRSDSGKYIKDYNTVFLIKVHGTPKPLSEVQKIIYYNPCSKIRMYKSSKEILDRFLQDKINVL